MRTQEGKILKYQYFMDKEGRLLFEGNRITDPWAYRFFQRSLKQTEEGRFLVLCENEYCYIEVEDVPYVIIDIAVTIDETAKMTRIELLFNGGYKEALDPSSIFVSKENILYCRVRGGKFSARFNRTSYYRIAKLIEHNEEIGEFQIEVRNETYNILRLKQGERDMS